METTVQAPAPLQSVARGSVQWITLDRPQAFNSLSESLLAALQLELDRIAADPQVKVVVIGGSGKAFCAGHDLHEMRADPSEAYYRELFAQCGRMMLAIQRMPQPVIARVHGIATAAGCQLVAMCDLAVSADNARFAVSGVNLGLFCSTPAVPLSRNIPRKAAMEMLLTGEFIDAQRALQWGLVNRVVPEAELDAAVTALAERIAAKPRVAIAMGKELFYRQLEMGIEGAYQLAGQTMACNMMEPPTLEGVQAFIDKRKPNW
jgi:enoyl-CoA hydratase/carnithine racemase